jgi:hypothetical protein
MTDDYALTDETRHELKRLLRLIANPDRVPIVPNLLIQKNRYIEREDGTLERYSRKKHG